MCVRIDASVPAKILQALAVAVLFGSTVAATDQDEPYRVLVLHSFRHSLTVNTDWYNGIVRGFTAAPDLRIWIDVEAPDLSLFGDADYIADLNDIYSRKYRDDKPQLIIPTYTPALQFLLDHGDDLFPGSPIVFCGADDRAVAGRELPAHVTGVTILPDIAGTLDLALHVHPDTRRVAVIVGSGAFDQQFEHDARQAFQPFGDRVEFIWLRGMPLAELTEAVRKLPDQTVILYLVQLQDRTGKLHVPLQTTRQLATVAKAPIYGLWDTLLGHGIVGGRLATLEDDGFRVAQMGLRILRGEAPAAIPVIHRQGNDPIFHGGELQRRNIDMDRLPAGSRVLHRQATLWEEHWKTILSVALLVGFQGLLIVVLLLNRAKLRRSQTKLHEEHDRRRQAEDDARGLRGTLSRLSSERALGTVATTIAHEVNQPLIAIQNYTQAASRRARSLSDQESKLDELLEKIEGQASRAGEIIQRIRALVGTSDPRLRPVLLATVISQVVDLMEADFESQRCTIVWAPTTDSHPVLADRLQVQLVLVNLLSNAVRSMACCAGESDKVIGIDIRRINDGEEQVRVVDRGPGVPPERAQSVFEPFSSSSEEGMGIGLAICRSIIDAHGGRIWYEPNPSGGAVFLFTLRVAAS